MEINIKETKIKICGLRRIEDIQEINKYNEIKYAGFIFYPKSKRYITPMEACELTAALREDIKAVGVFVNSTPEDIEHIAAIAHLDIIQLHSDEDADFCKRLKGFHLWRALRVRDEASLAVADEVAPYVDGFVLDTYTPEYGGCGKVFNWALAKDFAKSHFTMLAGGIGADNISEAIAEVQPNGIDLSSAVETDGFKDADKIRELIESIR
jgi:phosphoribosylanthranilate isomerase